jgi:hypothetical protein
MCTLSAYVEDTAEIDEAKVFPYFMKNGLRLHPSVGMILERRVLPEGYMKEFGGTLFGVEVPMVQRSTDL